MKEGYTHISFVIDRSGSMQSIAADTIGGFNTFLKTQKEAPGEATFSLTQFDDKIDLVYSFVNINEVPDLTSQTFVPRGWTALYDAIGMTIDGCGRKLREMKESDRPEKVIVVILTDGEENHSREYNFTKIQKMIKDQTDKYSWEFVFLGANLDAKALGTSMGIKGGNSMTFAANAAGTDAVFSSMSANLTSYRSLSSDKLGASYKFFNSADEDAQKSAGA